LNRSQNPGGHKEGRASFPIKSQYKNLINPYLYSLERRGREKRKRDRKRGVAPGEGGGVVLVCLAQRDRRGVTGYLRCPRRGPKYA